MAKTCVVLIAVDSSRQAESAFNWYIEHIHKPGNTIVVLHCVDLDAITEHGLGQIETTSLIDPIYAVLSGGEIRDDFVILNRQELAHLSPQGIDNPHAVEEYADESSVRLWDQHKNKIKALDDKYRWKLNENGLPGKIRTESGKPGDVIIQTASQEKVGLIVIGSRGQGKLKRTMSGSVSDYVLHHSKCPVVICKAKD